MYALIFASELGMRVEKKKTGGGDYKKKRRSGAADFKLSAGRCS
jgi:stalled ribosome alternative rescue factor ArfA